MPTTLSPRTILAFPDRPVDACGARDGSGRRRARLARIGVALALSVGCGGDLGESASTASEVSSGDPSSGAESVSVSGSATGATATETQTSETQTSEPTATTMVVTATATTAASATTTGATATPSSETATTTETSTTSTTSGSTGTTSGMTTGDVLMECPSIAAGAIAAIVDDPAIDEASGMVASRTQDGVLWLHNDSGDDPRVFAMTTEGEALGIFNLAGADAEDWEDMAVGPGESLDPEGDPWLYLGDIGDNPESRPSITVYRIPEPDAYAAEGEEVTVEGVEAIELVYPDGAHNAETLLVDPISGELVIVTKGDTTGVYRLPGPIAAGGPYELEKIAPVNIPLTITTGGDVSPLGDFVIVRTYIDARLWVRPPDTGLAESLAGEPCTIPLKLEIQGETLAIAADGGGYYSLSEKVGQPLWWYARE